MAESCYAKGVYKYKMNIYSQRLPHIYLFIWSVNTINENKAPYIYVYDVFENSLHMNTMRLK